MLNKVISEVIRDWKKDAGVTHIILFRRRQNTLTIYTDHPGPLIGLRGERYDRFKARLLKKCSGFIDTIKFEETDGIA